MRIRGLLHRLRRLACRGRGAEAPGAMLTYLHDDVEGQIEQQVTDEDAQHVGSKVPGSVDESKESAEHMGRNYFAAMKRDW